MAFIFEFDLDWILYPSWGPKWVRNVTKLIHDLPVSCSSVVSDFMECQVNVHVSFWSGLFSSDPWFSLEKHTAFQRFLAWQSIASPKKSHQFFTSQVINKMIKNHLQVNKTLPRIGCEKVIDFWLSFYVKLASKSVPKLSKTNLGCLAGAPSGPSECNLDCPGVSFAA